MATTTTTNESPKNNEENISNDDEVDDSIHVFPMALPPFSNGPLIGELGFSRTEELALKQAWRILKPYRRRFSRTVFYLYLRENTDAIHTFRFHGVYDLHSLHEHAMRMMIFVEGLIEIGLDNPVEFQKMITRHFRKHAGIKNIVPADSMLFLATKLKDCLLLKLKTHASATLKKAFDKLFDLFTHWNSKYSISDDMFMSREQSLNVNM